MSGNYSEVVIIVVQNSQKQFLVHQRSSKKKISPSLWGLGAGGRIEPNEKPQAAAKRELMEELQIDAEPKFLFTFPFDYTPYGSGTNGHTHIFHVVYNGTPTSCDEFQWTGWMNKEEIDTLSKENKMCPDTKIAWEKLKQEFKQLL
ncbi:MAG: NUDIX domain-containing protein [Candidatus Woesearchaeota archaeon]|nr:NUDIX domain-containing protein [Candidatus Woesearchaeota archaeon]